MKAKKGKIIGIIAMLIVLALVITALILISVKPKTIDVNESTFTNSFMPQTELSSLRTVGNEEIIVVHGIDF